MYELAVHLNPNCVEAHNNLGVIFKEKDNMERAVECYMAALSIRPNFPQVWEVWGWCGWRRRRRNADIARHVQQVLSFSDHPTPLPPLGLPPLTRSLNNLGVFYTSRGHAQEMLPPFT